MEKMCRSLIKNHEVTNWSNRLNADSDFDRFRFLHTNIEKAILWECGNDQTSLSHAYLVSKLWIENPTERSIPLLCNLCGELVDLRDIRNHKIIYCPYLSRNRTVFLNTVTATFGDELRCEIISGSSENRLQMLIGKQLHTLTSRRAHIEFLRMRVSLSIHA